MAKDFAKAFYNGKAWKLCRAAYVKSVFGLCERCGKSGYILHHKIALTKDNINNPDITLNWDNLEYLCLDCHNRDEKNEHELHRNRQKKELRYIFVAGEIRQAPPLKICRGVKSGDRILTYIKLGNVRIRGGKCKGGGGTLYG